MSTINSPIIFKRPKCSDKVVQLYWKSDPLNPIASGTTYIIQDKNGNASNVSGITGTSATFSNLVNDGNYLKQEKNKLDGHVIKNKNKNNKYKYKYK